MNSENKILTISELTYQESASDNLYLLSKMDISGFHTVLGM